MDEAEKLYWERRHHEQWFNAILPAHRAAAINREVAKLIPPDTGNSILSTKEN